MGDDEGRFEGLSSAAESLLSLERYCNDGSPSGFSDIHTTSAGHRPSDPDPHFNLPFYDVSGLHAVRLGAATSIANGLYPVHPDMVSIFQELTGLAPVHSEKAIPTSSPRTLYVAQGSAPFFAKLSYQGLIGRVTRRMSRKHVTSAIEVSHAFREAIETGKLPANIRIFDEYAGFYFDTQDALQDWGFVERRPKVCQFESTVTVPSFSLFATRNGTIEPLLHLIMKRAPNLAQYDVFFQYFIQPLLDLYFTSVIFLGLQPEAHSQNVLYLLDDQCLPIAAVLRDMESVDKDLGIVEYLALETKFTEITYKTLRPTDYNYQIMHSFMFDFKLGMYLIGPLVDCWLEKAGMSQKDLIEARIRKYSEEKISQLPPNYFPSGVWYNYDPIVHEGSAKRDYRAIPNPRFR
jgi:hypothetical protein